MTEEQFKIVNLSYTETASVIVKAETDDEAISAIHSSFSEIPDLKIISIEEADDELVEEVRKARGEQERSLN